MLLSILMLVRQVNDGRAEVENEFTRGVAPDGNPVALRLMKDVFVRRPAFAWRGLGIVSESALALAPCGEYAARADENPEAADSAPHRRF